METEMIHEIEFFDAIPRVVALERRQKRLRELVRYAKDNSPYLSKFYQNIDPETVSLGDLPIQERALMDSHFESWVTDPAIHKSQVQEFLSNPSHSALPFLGKYTAITTAGTADVPLIMIRDALHDQVHRTLLYKRLLGRIPAEWIRPDCNRVAAILQLNTPSTYYSSFIQMKREFAGNQGNILGLSTIEPIPELVRKLNDFQPVTLYGYASLLALLAMEQIHRRLKIAPRVMICTAEQLSDSAVVSMKEAFEGCAILNSYCATEAGEIAMTCPCGKLHVNEDWVILEPVDENDRPTSPMEVSDSVLVTDLSNFVQPIIRYRLDDRIQLMAKPCRCGSKRPVISVQGREADVVIFGNVLLPSIIFTTLMRDFPGVLSYQFAQTRRNRLEFRAVYPDGTDRAAFEENLREKVSSLLLGNGCQQVQFVFSDAPPRTSSRGGRVKSVVSEIWQTWRTQDEEE